MTTERSMNTGSSLLKGVSAISRSAFKVKGLGRVCLLLNALGLRLGASPIAYARMQDGTAILVDLRSSTEVFAYYFGTYETLLINTIKSTIRMDSCLLDVGANIGFYTIAIGKYLANGNGGGHVIAFEPYPGNYERLQENIRLNGLENHVHSANYGLSECSGEATLTLREDFAQGASTGNAAIATGTAMDSGFETVRIPLISLDSAWDGVNPTGLALDYIKVDIEGHEDLFLRGASSIIRKERPTILLEINKPYFSSRAVELDATFLPLVPKRYSLYRMDSGSWRIVKTLNECSEIDNLLMIPNEKLSMQGYRELFSSR